MDAGTLMLWVAERLLARFGALSLVLDDPPLETLVLTILSQNTSDTNRDRAYQSLLQHFGGFDRVREAPVEEIAESIRVGGLNQQKAHSISVALKRIQASQGRLSLAFLGELTEEEAFRWLLELPGVGPKTASIVLLFSFGRPFFPVDTHIRRVLTRVGILKKTDDPHKATGALLPQDAELLAALHLQTIQLGRLTCHPRNPECARCPLQEQCVWRTVHHADVGEEES